MKAWSFADFWRVCILYQQFGYKLLKLEVFPMKYLIHEPWTILVLFCIVKTLIDQIVGPV